MVVGWEAPLGRVVVEVERAWVGGVCQCRWEAWCDQKASGECRERAWISSWGWGGMVMGWLGGMGWMGWEGGCW